MITFDRINSNIFCNHNLVFFPASTKSFMWGYSRTVWNTVQSVDTNMIKLHCIYLGLLLFIYSLTWQYCIRSDRSLSCKMLCMNLMAFIFFGYVAVGGQGRGKILQRFPEKDWENCPFTQGIELVSIYIYIYIFSVCILLICRSGWTWKWGRENRGGEKKVMERGRDSDCCH